MDKPAKPDEDPVNELAESRAPPADLDMRAKLDAAIAALPKSESQPDIPPLPSLDEIAAALAPLQSEAKPADISNLPVSGLDRIEDIPPPLPPEPEISFAGVEYERRVHLRSILGYFHSVEPIVSAPESPQEANDALSRCSAILALLHACAGWHGDVRQIEFCIAGEERIQDELIGRLSSLAA